MTINECREGMEISKGDILNCDLCYEIIKVHNDCVAVREIEWDDEIDAYKANGNGGLIMAEELHEYEY